MLMLMDIETHVTIIDYYYYDVFIIYSNYILLMNMDILYYSYIQTYLQYAYSTFKHVLLYLVITVLSIFYSYLLLCNLL